MIEYSLDADGIAVILWNMPGRTMNVLNDQSIPAFAEHVRACIKDPKVKGVIISSAKPDFIAGADLAMLHQAKNPQDMFERGSLLRQLLREIEKAGKPFVAAINGTALGGGYEICLACHYRLAADNPKAQIGLPEVTVGLLPGGGGTQRLPRMIGIRNALPFLLEGKKLNPQAALKAGLVDKIVPLADLIEEARHWLLTEGAQNIVKPWDKKDFRIPGGAPSSPGVSQVFTAGNAMLHDKTKGCYPAPLAIMACVYEGCAVDLDTGLKIETRHFIKLATSPEAKNMIRTLFFSIGDANKLAGRPKTVPSQTYTKVGILGAGMMGAGIAYVSALAGLQVILLDTKLEAAEKGKSYSQNLLEKRVTQGKLTAEERAAILGRIKPTTDFADLKGCELVIEAVFENRTIKADVTQKTESVLTADAIFASNTSTLPITGLAEASARPENFIGLHFFSPVDRMPLVEIIRGQKTSDATLARAMDYVKKIRKTPITVNDSRGFYTSRVFSTYVSEGLAMLSEGVNPALIENAGRMAGMPVGPLALADEVSLDLMHKVRTQTAADLGAAYRPGPSDPVLLLMVEKLGRIGKKAAKGFYDYPQGEPKQLWPSLKEQFPLQKSQPSVEDVIERLMFVQSVETARCMEENVITDPRDADVGAVLGWGFAPARGGTISQIHSIGLSKFVEQCDRLAQRHGARFSPPKLLRDMVTKGDAFYAA